MANHGYIGKSDERHAFCHNYVKQLDRLIERLNKMKNNFKIKKEPPKKRFTRKRNTERTLKNSQLSNNKKKP